MSGSSLCFEAESKLLGRYASGSLPISSSCKGLLPLRNTRTQHGKANRANMVHEKG